jgi:preprotein translocase subunit SecE
MSKQQPKKGMIDEKVDFFKQSWLELKKVHPPTREETWRASVSVIFMVALFGLFLGLTDLIVGGLIKSLLGIG